MTTQDIESCDELLEVESVPKSAEQEALVRQRLRLRYRKDEVLCYTGHLDLIRLIGRWFRRADIPYATSGYYSPKPRISFGPILPLGALGDNELLDVELLEGTYWSAEDINSALQKLKDVTAPRDFAMGFAELDSSVQNVAKQARFARYRMLFTGKTPLLQAELDKKAIPYVDSRQRSIDLKSGVLEYALNEGSLEVTGGCGGDHHINPFTVAGYLKQATAAVFTETRRLYLLDNEMIKL